MEEQKEIIESKKKDRLDLYLEEEAKRVKKESNSFKAGVMLILSVLFFSMNIYSLFFNLPYDLKLLMLPLNLLYFLISFLVIVQTYILKEKDK